MKFSKDHDLPDKVKKRSFGKIPVMQQFLARDLFRFLVVSNQVQVNYLFIRLKAVDTAGNYSK